MEQFGRLTRVHNLFHPADRALCRADVFFSAAGAAGSFFRSPMVCNACLGLQGLARRELALAMQFSEYQAGKRWTHPALTWRAMRFPLLG